MNMNIKDLSFPFNAPIKIVKPLTNLNDKKTKLNQHVHGLTDNKKVYVFIDEDKTEIDSDFFLPFTWLLDIVNKTFDEDFNEHINLSKYIIIVINSLIYCYDNLETQSFICFRPIYLLFVHLILIELLLPINGNKISPQQSKHLIQGCLQRIFYCYANKKITPNRLEQELKGVQSFFYTLGIKKNNLAKNIEYCLNNEYNLGKEYLEKKKQRIIMTYCKYFIRNIKNEKQDLNEFFKNKSGIDINQGKEIQDIAVFPQYFFKSDYYLKEIMLELKKKR